MSKAIEDALAVELEALEGYRKPADVLREINAAKAHWLAFERQSRRLYEAAIAREAREYDGPVTLASGHLKRNKPARKRA